jgi:hypothetical protein
LSELGLGIKGSVDDKVELGLGIKGSVEDKAALRQVHTFHRLLYIITQRQVQ